MAMFNLLKSDLFRLVRGKRFWIYLASTVALTIVFAYWSFSVIEGGGSLTVTVGIVSNTLVASDTPEQLLSSFYHMFATMVLGSPIAPLLILLLVAALLSVDFKTGFIRNIRAVRTKRALYYAEKLVFASLLVAAVLLVALIVVAIIALAMRLRFQTNACADFLMRLLLTWLTFTAYACIVATLLFASRRKFVGVLTALLFGFFIVNSALSSLMLAAETTVPALSGASDWLLHNNILQLRDSSLALGDIAVHVACTSIVVIAVCAVLTFGLISRKEL